MTSYTPACRNCAEDTRFYAVSCEGCRERARAKGVALKGAPAKPDLGPAVAKMAAEIEAEVFKTVTLDKRELLEALDGLLDYAQDATPAREREVEQWLKFIARVRAM